jgi:hypothetical protein
MQHGKKANETIFVKFEGENPKESRCAATTYKFPKHQAMRLKIHNYSIPVTFTTQQVYKISFQKFNEKNKNLLSLEPFIFI